MKVFLKIIKWVALSIGGILSIIIIASLLLQSTAPHVQPPGELVDVGGYKLHINGVGKKNDHPTLVIEAGAGAFSEYYYWLGEGLKDSMRVVRYDRAGIGYSELSDAPRDPETTARDLHALLENSGESPPYIMAGHSYGGHYMRIFTKLYPNEVAGMVFLDAPHPDEHERLNMSESPSYMNSLYKVGAVLGDLGVFSLFERTVQPLLIAPGLPKKVTMHFTDYLKNGKYLRGYLEEQKWYEHLVSMAREYSDYGNLPVRVFAGTHLNEKLVRELGLDPDIIRRERKKMQEEVAAISTDGEVFFMDGGHFFFIEKESADIVCHEILEML